MLAALFLLEGLLVLLDRFPPPPSPVQIEPLPGGQVRLRLQRGWRNVEVVKASPAAHPGMRRIAVVGDSTIYGTHLREHSTIPRLLETLLVSATRERWEALNLGAEAVGVREVCALAETALEEFAPELLVVYTGHNEFLPHNVRPHREAQSRPLRAAIARAFGWSRLARGLLTRDAASHVRPPPGRLESRTQGGILARSGIAATRPRVHHDFQRRLERLVRGAAARGVPTLLVGPTSNGREYGPVGSAFSKPLSHRAREEFDESLDEAVAHFHAGDLDRCEAALEEAAAIDDQVADLLHLRSAVLWARGEEQRARLLDLEKWGLDEGARAASREILERVAAAAHASGAYFVPLGPLLERLPREGEPLFFLDQMHPSVYGQYLIARTLAPVCAEALEVASSGRWLEYEEAWRSLGVPEELLESQELFHIDGNVVYAFWAIDPLPYMKRARDLLTRFSASPVEAIGREASTLMVLDLYLSILEEDAERVLDIADAFRSTDLDLVRVLSFTEDVPRLRQSLARAGLELRLTDPQPLRRAD